MSSMVLKFFKIYKIIAEKQKNGTENAASDPGKCGDRNCIQGDTNVQEKRKQSSHYVVLGQWLSIQGKIHLDSYLALHTKNNSKYIRDECKW